MKNLRFCLFISAILLMCTCGHKSKLEQTEEELIDIAQKGYWFEFEDRLYNLLFDENSLEYPFKKLGKVISICTSDDKKIRIFEWNDGTGNYNGGFHHIINYQNAIGRSYCTTYEEAACIGCVKDDWDCRGFEVYTAVLNGKTYYIIEVGLMQAAGYMGNREIAVYAIEDYDLIKKSVFNTKKEILSEIGFEYDAASYYYDFVENDDDFKKDEKSFDWLFRYDDKQKIIYVPLVNGLKVTDKYLLYQWDGKYFTYQGISKFINKIPK